MAHVTLIGNLRQYAGGKVEHDVDAANVRQLFERLGARYPELLPHLVTGSCHSDCGVPGQRGGRRGGANA